MLPGGYQGPSLIISDEEDLWRISWDSQIGKEDYLSLCTTFSDEGGLVRLEGLERVAKALDLLEIDKHAARIGNWDSR
jgi:hypothetical protein